MKININRNQDDMLFCIKLKQAVIYKRTQNRIAILAFTGIALIIWGRNSYNDVCFNLYTVGGALFIGCAIMSYYETHMASNIGFSANDAISHHLETTFLTKIEITENVLCYDTLKNHYEINWRTFNMFKIYKKHIFLFRNNNYCNSFVIKKSELSKEEFAEFYNFLSSNMMEKR